MRETNPNEKVGNEVQNAGTLGIKLNNSVPASSSRELPPTPGEYVEEVMKEIEGIKSDENKMKKVNEIRKKYCKGVVWDKLPEDQKNTITKAIKEINLESFNKNFSEPSVPPPPPPPEDDDAEAPPPPPLSEEATTESSPSPAKKPALRSAMKNSSTKNAKNAQGIHFSGKDETVVYNVIKLNDHQAKTFYEDVSKFNELVTAIENFKKDNKGKIDRIIHSDQRQGWEWRKGTAWDSRENVRRCSLERNRTNANDTLGELYSVILKYISNDEKEKLKKSLDLLKEEEEEGLTDPYKNIEILENKIGDIRKDFEWLQGDIKNYSESSNSPAQESPVLDGEHKKKFLEQVAEFNKLVEEIKKFKHDNKDKSDYLFRYKKNGEKKAAGRYIHLGHTSWYFDTDTPDYDPKLKDNPTEDSLAEFYKVLLKYDSRSVKYGEVNDDEMKEYKNSNLEEKLDSNNADIEHIKDTLKELQQAVKDAEELPLADEVSLFVSEENANKFKEQVDEFNKLVEEIKKFKNDNKEVLESLFVWKSYKNTLWGSKELPKYEDKSELTEDTANDLLKKFYELLQGYAKTSPFDNVTGIYAYEKLTLDRKLSVNDKEIKQAKSKLESLEEEVKKSKSESPSPSEVLSYTGQVPSDEETDMLIDEYNQFVDKHNELLEKNSLINIENEDREREYKDGWFKTSYKFYKNSEDDNVKNLTNLINRIEEFISIPNVWEDQKLVEYVQGLMNTLEAEYEEFERTFNDLIGGFLPSISKLNTAIDELVGKVVEFVISHNEYIEKVDKNDKDDQDRIKLLMGDSYGKMWDEYDEHTIKQIGEVNNIESPVDKMKPIYEAICNYYLTEGSLNLIQGLFDLNVEEFYDPNKRFVERLDGAYQFIDACNAQVDEMIKRLKTLRNRKEDASRVKEASQEEIEEALKRQFDRFKSQVSEFNDLIEKVKEFKGTNKEKLKSLPVFKLFKKDTPWVSEETPKYNDNFEWKEDTKDNLLNEFYALLVKYSHMEKYKLKDAIDNSEYAKLDLDKKLDANDKEMNRAKSRFEFLEKEIEESKSNKYASSSKGASDDKEKNEQNEKKPSSEDASDKKDESNKDANDNEENKETTLSDEKAFEDANDKKDESDKGANDKKDESNKDANDNEENKKSILSRKETLDAANDAATQIVESGTGSNVMTSAKSTLNMTNGQKERAVTLVNKNDKQGLKKFFAELFSKLPAESVKSFMAKLPNPKKAIKRVLKGKDKILAEQKEKLGNMFKDYIDFSKAHQGLIGKFSGMGENELKVFKEEFGNKHKNINLELWFSGIGNSNDINTWITAIKDVKNSEKLAGCVKTLYGKLVPWLPGKYNYEPGNDSRSNDKILEDTKEKLNIVIGKLWRDFSQTAERYLSSDQDEKQLFGNSKYEGTADGSNLEKLDEEIAGKFKALIKTLYEEFNKGGFLKSICIDKNKVGRYTDMLEEAKSVRSLLEDEGKFLDYAYIECDFVERLVNGVIDNDTQFISKASEIYNKFGKSTDQKDKYECIKRLYLLAEKAVEAVIKAANEAETNYSDKAITNTLNALKTKTNGLLTEYNKIYMERTDLWGNLADALLPENVRFDLNKASTVKEFVQVLENLILKGVLKPKILEKSNEKFRDKLAAVKNANAGWDTDATDVAANKSKIDCMTQMYELAAKAVNHLKNVVAKLGKQEAKLKHEKEELNKKGVIGKAGYKLKKFGRAVGKKVDKTLGTDHVFHSKKEKGEESGITTDTDAAAIKNLGKCFKKAAEYIVKLKLTSSFKRATVLSSFSTVSSDGKLRDWHTKLCDILKGNTVLSPISLDGDDEKEYKKATVAVLLASICGLPSSSYVVAACDNLKNGGLKGKFEGRKYLNDAIAIRKELKKVAVANPDDDGSGLENRLNTKKSEFESLIKNYASFKSKVLDGFIDLRKKAAKAAAEEAESAPPRRDPPPIPTSPSPSVSQKPEFLKEKAPSPESYAASQKHSSSSTPLENDNVGSDITDKELRDIVNNGATF